MPRGCLCFWLPGPERERSGIVLEADGVWEISRPKNTNTFFLALGRLLPEGSMLYLEDVTGEEVAGFLSENRIMAPVEVMPGTLCPEPDCFHITADRKNLEHLTTLARNYCEVEICFHLVAYRETEVLLSWYDAWTDAMWLSPHFSETESDAFSREIEASYQFHEGKFRAVG